MEIQNNIANNTTTRNCPICITIRRFIYHVFYVVATMFVNKIFKLIKRFGKTYIIDMCIYKIVIWFIHICCFTFYLIFFTF